MDRVRLTGRRQVDGVACNGLSGRRDGDSQGMEHGRGIPVTRITVPDGA